MRNQVQLIAYADRLGGSLARLTRVLRDHFADAFGGVHVLPFFTPFDGADAGFDPVNHTEVDPRLGTWDDVRELSRSHDTVVDLIVNHVSSSSPQFQDMARDGDQSLYADMFLTMSAVFPHGATEADLTAIYRPRPGLPFTPMTLGGVRRLVWTTFTPHQIDIDVYSPSGRAYLSAILDAVAAAGVSMIRLDAVGYAVKKAGSSCFMIPETFEFIDEFTTAARARGVDVLVEVHSYYQHQVEIGRSVDRVYDFALPPLVLHALYTGNGSALARWMQIRPLNAVTVLDTHDGIGVIDVGPDHTAADPANRPGLLTPTEINALVDGIHNRTSGTSRRATGGAARNLDVYQVNSTYYDAVGRDDLRYLAARALQLFTPGIPQIYYVGALAGTNDVDLLSRTGIGRDINRRYYTPEEIDAALDRPVVQALLALCRFRNNFDVFGGDFDFAADDAARVLCYAWRAEEGDTVRRAELKVDVATGAASLEWETSGTVSCTDNLLERPPLS